MNIDLIPVGDNPPESLNVIIEVPVGGEPVKYEFDKKSGALFVDRILHTPMRYPANYGFVTHTMSPDGDPLDALVVARSPFIPGSVVRARPSAVLFLEDEAGGDEKLLTVPVDRTFPYYENVGEHTDLPTIVMQQIEHFFTHYKDLEPKKWVRVGHWGSADDARKVVTEAIARASARTEYSAAEDLVEQIPPTIDGLRRHGLRAARRSSRWRGRRPRTWSG